MSLEDRRIWLATRGGERTPHYQAALVTALREAGASSVEVVGFESILRQAAQELGSRAGDWLESTAGRLARGLRIDRLLRLPGEPASAAEAASPPAAESAPDVAIVDDPRLLSALRVAPAYEPGSVLTIGLVDDFCVDTRWRGAPVDALVVPHEALGAAYRSAGGPAVVVAGPPVGQAWMSTRDSAAARAALDLPAQGPVVLVAAERMDSRVLDRAVFQLTLVDPAPVVLFHVGQSAERGALLRDAATEYGLQAALLGEVSDPGGIYAAADVLLVAADDPALPELLQCGRAVLLLGPDRGAARAAFLADHGAVAWVEDAVELSTHLESLLAQPAGRAALVERAAALVPADGAARVARAVDEALAQAAAAAAAPPPEPSAPPGGGPSGPPVPRGPLEPIGVPPAEARRRPAAPPPITTAEAKDQLATLILKEREAERGLHEAVGARDRWLGRLDLAKEAGDDELARIAGEHHRQAAAEVARRNGQIELLRRSKEKLKARVARPAAAGPPAAEPAQPRPTQASDAGSDVEARFRKMEIERDLRRLRRKIDDERGPA